MPPTATLAAAPEDHSRSSQSIRGSDDPASDRFPSSVKLIGVLDIRCVESTCYVLSNNADSKWDGFLTTEAGTNSWRHIRFDPTAVVRALTADQRHPAPDRFAALAFLPTGTGIYVSGVAHAGDQLWGAVLRVDPAGEVTSVGHGIPVGLGLPADLRIPSDLWILEQAPDGTLWTGGQGAYRLQEGEWVKVWPAQGS